MNWFHPQPDDSRSGFFRGSEFPRMMILAGVLVVGLVAVLNFTRPRQAPIAPAKPATTRTAPWPPRDDDPAFEGIEDKVRLSRLDDAAYRLLLERARNKTYAEIDRDATRSALFAHIWGDPERFRGVPIRLHGRAMRILVDQEVRMAKNGRLHELWMRTEESSPFPYCVVFEDVPPGFPAGPAIDEEVLFVGYFLKLIPYEARDTTRAAPLLIGRLKWVKPRGGAAASPGVLGLVGDPDDPDAPAPPPGPAAPVNGWSNPNTLLPMLLVGSVLVYAVVRLGFSARGFQRLLASLPRVESPSDADPDATRYRSSAAGSGPTRRKRYSDRIDPETLQAWVARASEEEEAESDGNANRDRRSSSGPPRRDDEDDDDDNAPVPIVIKTDSEN